MCGICGAIFVEHGNFPIGSILYKMMESQQIRAQDSTGIAVFNKDSSNEFCRLGYFKENLGAYEACEEEVLPERLEKLLCEMKGDPNVSITSVAREMKMVKDVGLVKDLDLRYKIKSMEGSHGIGHLRIATSSRVVPYNAHPFSTTIMPDIAVVHNGEITNYSKLRASLELEGYPFYSNCDSEVIAVFIADQMLKHGDIEKAHDEFVKKADGPFTYIAAMPEEVAIVRDKFGSRKCIVGYNPGYDDFPPFWAMATDLSALDLVGATYNVETPQPGKPRIFYRR